MQRSLSVLQCPGDWPECLLSVKIREYLETSWMTTRTNWPLWFLKHQIIMKVIGKHHCQYSRRYIPSSHEKMRVLYYIVNIIVSSDKSSRSCTTHSFVRSKLILSWGNSNHAQSIKHIIWNNLVRPEDVGPLTPRLAARALLGLSLPPHLQPPESGDQSPGSPASVTSVASPLTNNTLLTLALAKVSSARSEPLDHCLQAVPRRPRGEKKPIPEDLKDG